MDHARDTLPRGDDIARDRAPIHAGGNDGERDRSIATIGPVNSGSSGLGSGVNGPVAGPPAVPVLAVVPPTASARLRTAREALGLTTGDIAAKSRITGRYIDALDRGNFGALPGRPYVLGFVRTYARMVGLDATEMVNLARAEMDAGVPRPAPRAVHQYDVDDPAKTPSRTVTWVAFALVIAVLVTGGVFWRSYYAPGATLPSLVQPDPTPHAPPPAVIKPAAAPVGLGPVVFTARENGIWVKFYDGHGTQLLQKQLALGESYTVPAAAFEPRLWTGRPDALAITIGGQPVAPLADHRGIMRDVPVTAQALMARARSAAPGVLPVQSAATNGASPGSDGSHHRARHRLPDPAPVPAPAATLAPVTPASSPPATSQPASSQPASAAAPSQPQ